MSNSKQFYSELIPRLDKILAIDKNFDLMNRRLSIGDRDASLYLVDGFVKDELLQKMLQQFQTLKKSDMPDSVHDLLDACIPFYEVDLIETEEEILKQILSGVPCLFIDGYDKGIAIDCRTYPARSVDEPEKDKVMRGSKDGFVETVVFNTALIRRRIRDPKLRMEMFEVGDSSRTDVVVCYVDGRADETFLSKLRDRLKELRVDALSLNQESLAEALYESTWLNPFPNFKYCERPDSTAASLLEGQIAILVDNSPAAMLLPTSFFDIMEEANDYYFPPITGTYIRLTRFIINLITWLMTPTFLLFVLNPTWLPPALSFILVKEPQNIPLFWQFIFLEIAIDGLRLASINTPTMLSTPLSVVAGLVIGEFAVSSGWFNAEAMLYMAFVAISTYAMTSFEIGYALKFMRLLLLILTQLFELPGYIIGVLITIGSIAFNKTLFGRNYLYPLIPFDGRQLLKRLFRVSLKWSEKNKKTKKG